MRPSALFLVALFSCYCFCLAGSTLYPGPAKGIVHGTTKTYWGVVSLDKQKVLALIDKQDPILNSPTNGLTLLDVPGYSSQHPLLFQFGVDSNVGVSKLRTKVIGHATIYVPYVQNNEKGGPFTMKLVSMCNDSIPIMGPGAIYGGAGTKVGYTITISEQEGRVTFDAKSASDVGLSASLTLQATPASGDDIFSTKLKPYLTETPLLVFRRISSYPIFECFEYTFNDSVPVTAKPVASCSLTIGDSSLSAAAGTYTCEWAAEVSGYWELSEAVSCGKYQRSVDQGVIDKQRPMVARKISLGQFEEEVAPKPKEEPTKPQRETGKSSNGSSKVKPKEEL